MKELTAGEHLLYSRKVWVICVYIVSFCKIYIIVHIFNGSVNIMHTFKRRKFKLIYSKYLPKVMFLESKLTHDFQI